jgi:hypothetical protein
MAVKCMISGHDLLVLDAGWWNRNKPLLLMTVSSACFTLTKIPNCCCPQGYVAEKLTLAYGMLKSVLTSIGLLGGQGAPVASDKGRTTTATLKIGKDGKPLGNMPADPSSVRDQASEHAGSNPYSVPGLADNLEKMLHETPEEHAAHAKYIQAMHEEMATDRYRRQITG